MKGAREETWIGEQPGSLPWWQVGRPPRAELEDPDLSGRARRAGDRERQAMERPELELEEFLALGCRVLSVALDDLAGRGRSPTTVSAREVLALLAAERYGLRLKGLAARLGKHQVTASTWIM